MTYLTAVILGLVQGIAEFLPISSSGHLSLLQNFMGLTNIENDHMFFDVLLHFGTLISVLIVYREDVIDMICEFFRGIASLFSRSGNRTATPPPARRMVLLIIIATLPLFVVLPIKDLVSGLYGNTIFISCALLVTGFVLFFSDRMAKGRKTARNATIADALIVGCAQAVATVPGLSRSGSTIATGMVRGFKRDFAVRFSFLMSLPAVLGANILSLIDAVKEGFDTTLLPMYLVGVLVAMVSGYFAIRLVKMLADKGKFGKFAYYCWIVGAVTLIMGLVKFMMPLT